MKTLIVVGPKLKKMVEKQISVSISEKNNNNNNVIHNNTHNIIHKFGQLDLNGNVVDKIKLRGYQKAILEVFYLNHTLGISQSNLFSALPKLHLNTINNFIKTALNRGWICKLKIIEGARLSSAYFDVKQPDYLKETGQSVYDKRYSYYKITKIGINIFESL